MMRYIISVVQTIREMQFNILDATTLTQFRLEYKTLRSRMVHNQIYIVNARVASDDAIVGINGSISKYTVYNGYNKRKSPLSMVILKKTGNEYTISSPTGEVKTVTEDKLIEVLKHSNWKLANGILLNKQGKDIIIAPEKEYPSELKTYTPCNLQETSNIALQLINDKVNKYQSKLFMIGKTPDKICVINNRIYQKEFGIQIDDDNIAHIYINKLSQVAIIEEEMLVNCGCSYIVIHADGAELQEFRIKHMSSYRGLRRIHVKIHIPYSNITNLDGAFLECRSLSTLDLSEMSVKRLTSMQATFAYCSQLKSVILGNWDTSCVDNYSELFSHCEVLKNVNINKLDTQSALTLSSMFMGCYHMKKIDVSSFNTANSVAFDCMFKDCEELEQLDITNFSISDKATTDLMLQGTVCKVKLPKEFETTRDPSELYKMR